MSGFESLYDNTACPLREATHEEDRKARSATASWRSSSWSDWVGRRKVPREDLRRYAKRAGMAASLVLDPQIILLRGARTPASDPVRNASLSQC